MPPKNKRKTTSEPKHPLEWLKRIYNVHTLEPLQSSSDGWQYGCFIDIGSRNMSLRFSRAHSPSRVIEGLSQDRFDFELAKGTKASKAILAAKSQIGIRDDMLSQMVLQFNRIRPQLGQCQYIVIEKQIKGATWNLEVMNKLIGILSVLMVDYGNRPLIIEIDPSQKSVPLGGPRSMQISKALKDWCYQMSLVILERNGGHFDLQLLQEMKSLTKYGRNKRDDPADTICYCYVWWEQYIFSGLVNRETLAIPLP